MNDQRDQTRPTRKFTPWADLAVSFVGALAGAGLSAAVGARDPWNLVITAVTAAVVLLVGWAVVNLRRQRSSK
ncbi:hypothetical protein ACVLV4_000352 [Rathayibacter agropyri]